MFFDGTVNQNENGVWTFLHAILKLTKRSHIPIAVKLRFFCTNNIAEYYACITGASKKRPRLKNQGDLCIWRFVTYHLSDNWWLENQKSEAHSLPSVSGRYQPDGLPSIICVDGQTLPKRRPQTKDAQAPVPRVRVFPIMSLLKSELN